jgi:hypothetical protein
VDFKVHLLNDALHPDGASPSTLIPGQWRIEGALSKAGPPASTTSEGMIWCRLLAVSGRNLSEPGSTNDVDEVGDRPAVRGARFARYRHGHLLSLDVVEDRTASPVHR